MSKNKLLMLFLVSIIISLHTCECVSVEEEITLSHSEKLALDRFREIVSKDLTQDYMHKDIYLIKWLRAKSFDVRAAKEMLLRALKWRKENAMDEILSEDFKFSEREYPFYVDGVDFTGRPVGCFDVGVYDARRAVVAGKMDEVYRYALQALERGVELVRKAQAEGRNVTQATLIVNLDGFTIIRNACVQSPSTIDFLVRILWPLASPYTQEAVLFFGANKQEWKNAILKEIPAEQIRLQFGGTLLDQNELESDY